MVAFSILMDYFSSIPVTKKNLVTHLVTSCHTGDEEEPCHTTDSASCHEHDVLCLHPGDIVFLIVLSVYSVEKINLTVLP